MAASDALIATNIPGMTKRPRILFTILLDLASGLELRQRASVSSRQAAKACVRALLKDPEAVLTKAERTGLAAARVLRSREMPGVAFITGACGRHRRVRFGYVMESGTVGAAAGSGTIASKALQSSQPPSYVAGQRIVHSALGPGTVIGWEPANSLVVQCDRVLPCDRVLNGIIVEKIPVALRWPHAASDVSELPAKRDPYVQLRRNLF